MSLGDLRRLSCPHCARPHDLFVLLDHLGGGFAEGPWADVGCPDCHGEAQLAFEGEDVAIGFVTLEPRASFEPTERVRQPGLRAERHVDGLVLALLHRHWVVPMRKRERG